MDVMRFHPDLAKSFAHTGFAPGRAAMRAGEEVAHGLGEIPQRLLLHGLRPGRQPVVLGPGLRQLSALLDVARRLTLRMPVLPLLRRQIPHISRIPTVRQQSLLLLMSRQQPEPRHNRTVTTDTDIRGLAARARLGIGFPAQKSGATSRRRLR